MCHILTGCDFGCHEAWNRCALVRSRSSGGDRQVSLEFPCRHPPAADGGVGCSPHPRSRDRPPPPKCMCGNVLLAASTDDGMQLGSTVEAMTARHRFICEPPRSSQLSAADHRVGRNRKSERRPTRRARPRRGPTSHLRIWLGATPVAQSPAFATQVWRGLPLALDTISHAR